MKTMIASVIATVAFATNVLAAPFPQPVCKVSNSTITPHGVWDCR